MHQGNNLTASIGLAWDNTSWGVASVWLIICALCLVCLMACLAHLHSHLSTNSCASWMSSHSSWALAWLTSHGSLREGWNHNPSIWVLAGWQPIPPSVWVHVGWLSDPPWVWVQSSRSRAGASRGLAGKWDWKDGVPPLTYPIGTLGDGGMSSNPLPPPHVVATPVIHWKEVAGTNVTCLREIRQKQCPQRKCPHPEKVHGMSL